jgi:hypothetical protein
MTGSETANGNLQRIVTMASLFILLKRSVPERKKREKLDKIKDTVAVGLADLGVGRDWNH